MSIFKKVVGGVARGGIKLLDKRRLPKLSGSYDLPGLNQKVSVNRDQNGVPHIQSNGNEDLFFAQGFVHAQDRLWQMELNRRTAKGTLSEIFGAVALDTDRIARTFGWKRLGEKDWENVSDELSLTINSYINGINAFINSMQTSLPAEFTLVKV